MGLDIAVVYGSVRTERQGIRAARYIIRKCEERGHHIDFIDPLEYQLPLLDRMYKEYAPGEAPETLERLAEIFKRVDAIVIVTGEYNHSIPPALSNLLDHFLQEYFWRPSAIVCYSAGGFGGVRAAMQMRMMVGELGMPSIPSLFTVPKVQNAFDSEGNALEAIYDKKIVRFLDELEWYAGALKKGREGGVPY